MKFVVKGRDKKNHQVGARDSSFRQSFLEPGKNVNVIRLGYIEEVNPEPLNINTRVSLSSHYTPQLIRNVAFPGASVSTDQSGSLGVTIKGLHGFYEGAVEGKMVSYAFADGNDQNPIVLNSYPYLACEKTGTKDNYVSPLTKKNFDPQDVFMSHFIGSYIVINSKLPVPGTIKALSKGRYLVESEIDVQLKAKTSILLDAKTSVELKALTSVKIDASTSVDIKGTSINLELLSGHKLSFTTSGLKYEDPSGNEFELGLTQAKFLFNGIETTIGSSGVVSDMDIVGGNATLPIGLLTHKHTGNLGLPTSPSIP